jgi:hypothetical protein
MYHQKTKTTQQNFIGPALVGFTKFFFLLNIFVSLKFSTSCDSRGFKRFYKRGLQSQVEV